MNRLAVLDARCAVWTPNVRALFERLLNAGPPTVDVVEALDHVGVFTRFVPEWDHVRSLPQRNAYHRFTVDRHLLETVAEAATFARAEAERGNPCSERELTLLLLGALMHDLAKGRPQDHSVLGAELARELAFRMGYHDADANTLSFLVRHHLLLADTAVRRDLNDPSTIQQVGAIVGDRHRLRVLLLLTLADTKATGPAAWSQSKATLMRTLAQRVEAWLVDGRIPDGGARREMLAEHATLLAGGAPHVEWRSHEDGLWECIVVAPDQRGLLAA
jgi:[protein-PII] uridylyltransferase